MPVRQHVKWRAAASSRRRHRAFPCPTAMYSTAAAGSRITRIVEPGRIGAVRLGQVASAAAPAGTRKSNVKVRIGARATTKISSEILVVCGDNRVFSLVAVSRDSLLVVMQFLLDTRPVGNQLLDFRLQLACVLGQVLKLVE